MTKKAVRALVGRGLSANQKCQRMSVWYSTLARVIFVPAQLVKDYCVTITMELRTSGGGGEGVDLTGVFCQVL